MSVSAYDESVDLVQTSPSTQVEANSTTENEKVAVTVDENKIYRDLVLPLNNEWQVRYDDKSDISAKKQTEVKCRELARTLARYIGNLPQEHKPLPKEHHWIVRAFVNKSFDDSELLERNGAEKDAENIRQLLGKVFKNYDFSSDAHNAVKESADDDEMYKTKQRLFEKEKGYQMYDEDKDIIHFDATKQKVVEVLESTVEKIKFLHKVLEDKCKSQKNTPSHTMQLLLIFSTHGGEGVLHFRDESINKGATTKKNEPKNEPSIFDILERDNGIPKNVSKVLIYQACRSSDDKAYNKGYRAKDVENDSGRKEVFQTDAIQSSTGESLEKVQPPQSTAKEPDQPDEEENLVIVPNGWNFLTAYATVPSYVSFREKEKGSCYIRQFLHRMVTEINPALHGDGYINITDVFMKVNHDFGNHKPCEHNKHCIQMPMFASTVPDYLFVPVKAGLEIEKLKEEFPTGLDY